MLSEGFSDEYKWIPNKGVIPVEGHVLVDVKWKESGVTPDYNQPAEDWYWGASDENNYCISHWRLHVPSKPPQPTRPAPPMPAIKPPKVDYVAEQVKANHAFEPPQEPSRVVQAFNRMTGHNITDDNLNTLKVLVELFGSYNGTN